MELTGKRIIITGATGFIGRNVAKQLLEQGAIVYALVRPESKQKDLLPIHENMHLLAGSMAEIGDWADKLGHADAFLHFAWGGVNRAEIDSPVVQAANVADSLACVEAAHKLGCQVFMDAGSRVEYGITADGTMMESMECHPVNAYGAAKLEFYQKAVPLCRDWNMKYYHLRFFSVYGTGDHPWSIISTLVRELPEGKTVSLSACRHRWNFMDIEDAARAVVELYRYSDWMDGSKQKIQSQMTSDSELQGRELQDPESQDTRTQDMCGKGMETSNMGETAAQAHIVNIASTDTRVLREFTEEIHQLCGGRGALEYGTFAQAKEGALSICPKVDALKWLTGGSWQERVTFSEGIRRMLEAQEK